MDAARSGDERRVVRDVRIDGLRAEASEAVGQSANVLRDVSQRYRQAYADELARWQSVRDQLDVAERAHDADAIALRAEVERIGWELGRQQTELAKLDIALGNLESTWLFLERGDTSLTADPEGLPSDVQMRIVEAQESERSRLAQDIHDGPAQVLSNAIFQVEYIERVIDTDLRTAKTELRFLRDLLRRELGSVRTFISQLRPP
ncbi:MAG TPA: histidine kinase dimerization/phosphoacceptor domain-containing protein, partial [Candidatus Limnocylindrales bacterium]|nr:histidine kinase dimerization/phosphoacceptor domain-containing protein [Candidatus Limnocylindrales bacterium]